MRRNLTPKQKLIFKWATRNKDLMDSLLNGRGRVVIVPDEFDGEDGDDMFDYDHVFDHILDMDTPPMKYDLKVSLPGKGYSQLGQFPGGYDAIDNSAMKTVEVGNKPTESQETDKEFLAKCEFMVDADDSISSYLPITVSPPSEPRRRLPDRGQRVK